MQLHTTKESLQSPDKLQPAKPSTPYPSRASIMLSTTNTRLWTQRRAEQPAALAAVCAPSKPISRTVQLHPSAAARSQLIVTNAVSRRSLVHYRVRGALGWLFGPGLYSVP